MFIRSDLRPFPVLFLPSVIFTLLDSNGTIICINEKYLYNLNSIFMMESGIHGNISTGT